MELEKRNIEELAQSLNLASYTLNKEYLKDLNSYDVVPFIDMYHEVAYKETDNVIKLLKLSKVCYEKGEDVLQKLSTIFNSTFSKNVNLIILIDSLHEQPVDFYIGFSSFDTTLGKNINLLNSGIEGNFTGTQLAQTDDLNTLFSDILDNSNTIASVSCSSSLRDNTKTQEKDFIQGIEKFIDAMQGKTYTAMFIAQPVEELEYEQVKTGLEGTYSTLSQFEKTTINYNEGLSNAVMSSVSNSLNTSVAVANGTNTNITLSTTETDTNSNTLTNSNTNTQTLNKSNSIGVNSSLSNTFGESQSNSSTSSSSSNYADKENSILKGIGAATGAGLGSLLGPVGIATGLGVGGLIGDTFSSLLGNSKSNTTNNSNTDTNTLSTTKGLSTGINQSNTHGESSAIGKSYSQASGKSSSHAIGNAKGYGETQSKTDTRGESYTNATADTETFSSAKSLQFEKKNKSVMNLLENIDEQLKTIEKGKTYGLFKFGAYFMSSNEENAILSANTYKALMIGDEKENENRAVNIWNDTNKISLIKEYLAKGSHPIFNLPSHHNMHYDATTIINGLELPIHMGIPTKSVIGLPVVEHIRFGRSVESTNQIKSDNSINLGNIYHMGKDYTQKVDLDLQTLASHTFVTGTTGSGKSNTVYKILEEVNKKQVKFLVIESAKGEYKDIFGHHDDVEVYGTNPRYTKFLRINPFSFNDKIHVLEHIDRLVDIFNVCWPMYAAMPSILKDAVVKSYEEAGWDLVTSQNKFNIKIYPTFVDILDKITVVLHESEYSADNKGDYIGALSTRIKSLTNGLNGMIFTQDDIPFEDVINNNVIVDLSRVGSIETKSLIMGILVMKLSEHYLSYGKTNANLQHVTVLEEAHNLLKRVSTEQSSESSNLQGKSVEMLSNAISEMRTYGEGFIISDQSPSLLDMSVIRNTNTKIIMKSPDITDRELIGKSIGLDENQIIELSKLTTGVGAIYQNNWLEAVLCKISKFDDEYKEFEVVDDYDFNKFKDIKDNLIELIRTNNVENIGNYRELVLNSNLKVPLKIAYLELLSCTTNEKSLFLRKFIYELFDGRKAFNDTNYVDNIANWKKSFMQHTSPPLNKFGNNLSEYVIKNLLLEQLLHDPTYTDISNEICTVTKKGDE